MPKIFLLFILFFTPIIAFAQSDQALQVHTQQINMEKAGHTQIYTWVDKHGITHYGDGQAFPIKQKSINVQKQNIKIHHNKYIQNTIKNIDKKNNKAVKISKNTKLAPDMTTACKISKKNVKLLSNKSKLAYKRDKNGTPVLLEGKSRLKALQKAIERKILYCK